MGCSCEFLLKTQLILNFLKTKMIRLHSIKCLAVATWGAMPLCNPSGYASATKTEPSYLVQIPKIRYPKLKKKSISKLRKVGAAFFYFVPSFKSCFFVFVIFQTFDRLFKIAFKKEKKENVYFLQKR